MAQASNSGPTLHIELVPVDRIRRDDAQARKEFDPAKLDELAASIQQVGVLEPLELRPDDVWPGGFVIVYGERRWRAAQIAGLPSVPAIIRDGRRVRRRQLYENALRADLNVVELADALAKLIEEEKLDTASLAEQLRWPIRKVQRLLEIHQAPESVKSAIAIGVTVEDARHVLPLRHALDIVRAFRHFAKTDKSATNENALRRTEKLLRRVLVEEWSAKRLQEFVAALGRGRRIREADLEVVLPQPKPALGDAAVPGKDDQARTVAAPSATASAKPIPALFDRSERRFILHLERARACTDPALRAKLARAVRELADEFAA